MAKWDFKIVGASFVKELIPVDGDVEFRSQSFMQPSFDLQGDKIVMKESGAYKTAIVFSQMGLIDGVAPTSIEDAYEKLLTLVENFNGGGGTPGTTPNLTQVLTQSGRLIKEWNSADGDYVFELEDLGKHLYFIGDGAGGDISASIPDDLFPMLKGVELQGSVKYGTNITLVYNESSPKTVTINSNNIDSFVRFNANQTEDNIWSVGLSSVPIPTKTSDLINDGDNGTSHFITLQDLPSNLILYPTNAASDIGGYFKIVSSITDPSYNATAVNVSTSAITGADQLVASLVTSSNIIIGNPGLFNITTIGNIRKISGGGQAEFYFRVYKRDLAGTETLIVQSDNTQQITSTIYSQFSSIGLWNDGVFLATDRIVLKFYATKVGAGSNPTYEFQFGGSAPVRTLVPIPLTTSPSPSIIERGVFNGQFSLNSTIGGEFTPLTQIGALTFSINGSAVNGGVDSVKITANGSAITIPGSWINIGSNPISTVNGAVNRIMVRQYQGEIWYVVKVN